MTTSDETSGPEGKPSSNETRLSPQLFSAGLRAVNALIDSLPDREPLALGDDWGIIEEVDLPSDTVSGKRASISGQVSGVYYALEFRLYNEIAGTSPDANPTGLIGDLRVRVQEGAPPDTKDHEYSQDEGSVYGLILPSHDLSIDTDFKHGTGTSANPEAQRVIDGVIQLYGFSHEEMFGTPERPNNGFGGYYDNERMQRFIDGMHKLLENPDVSTHIN